MPILQVDSRFRAPATAGVLRFRTSPETGDQGLVAVFMGGGEPVRFFSNDPKNHNGGSTISPRTVKSVRPELRPEVASLDEVGPVEGQRLTSLEAIGWAKNWAAKRGSRIPPEVGTEVELVNRARDLCLNGVANPLNGASDAARVVWRRTAARGVREHLR